MNLQEIPEIFKNIMIAGGFVVLTGFVGFFLLFCFWSLWTKLKKEKFDEKEKKRMDELKKYFNYLPSDRYKFEFTKNNHFDGKPFSPKFVSILKSKELHPVSQDEVEQRIKHLDESLCGQKHAEYLLEHQEKIPKKLQGKCLIFLGTVWKNDPEKERFPFFQTEEVIPTLQWCNIGWFLSFRDKSDNFEKNHLLVIF